MLSINHLFLAEGERLDKAFGWAGTKLGQGVLAAKKTSAPIVGFGLQKTGFNIAKAGRFVGKKVFDKGTNIRYKYRY
jgi:hypothetical protein